MRKKIAILGSTSSIGKSLLNIIKKDKKNFKIELVEPKMAIFFFIKIPKYSKNKLHM